MSPKVSVVIPTYNRAALLPRAVDSVLSQTLTDLELIVVDDASNDHTPNVVAAIDDPRVRPFRHERNKGVSAARNTAITIARGEYTAILDDDDELLPNALEDLVALMETSPRDVAFAYGWVMCIDVGAKTQDLFVSTLNGNLYEEAIGRITPVASNGTMFRTSLLLEIGGYDESIQFSEDIDLVTRLLVNQYEVRVLEKPVANHYTNYGAHQITAPRPSIAVEEQTAVRLHVARYAGELKERPEAHSRIYFRLALMAAECSNRAIACWALTKMVAVSPKPANFLLAAKIFLWHVSPLSYFRDRARSLRDKLRRTSP